MNKWRIDLATSATHNLQLYALPQEDPHQLIVQQNTKRRIALPMLCRKTPPVASHPQLLAQHTTPG